MNLCEVCHLHMQGVTARYTKFVPAEILCPSWIYTSGKGILLHALIKNNRTPCMSYIYNFLQFYTAGGIPFYVNLPSTILRLALGSPDISWQLHRYPVYTYCGPLTSVTTKKDVIVLTAYVFKYFNELLLQGDV